jgi:hypothetical protein
MLPDAMAKSFTGVASREVHITAGVHTLFAYNTRSWRRSFVMPEDFGVLKHCH